MAVASIALEDEVRRIRVVASSRVVGDRWMTR
jgi:hypothetical protein